MKLLIRIVLVVLAIPAGLFVVGFLNGLFGFFELPDRPEPEGEIVADAAADAPVASEPYRKPLAPQSDAGASVSEVQETARPEFQSFGMSPFPEAPDQRSALEWMVENALMVTTDAGVAVDPARFSTLTAEEALALLWAMKREQDAAKGERQDQMQMLAGLVFMGAAYMPEAERLAFAQDAQSVGWPGSGVDRYRSGEFVLMFFLKGAPYQPSAEAAIQRFAPMLPGSAILSALDRVNAINVGASADENWTYNMDMIRHLAPETLQALYDFIGPDDAFSNAQLREFGYAKGRLEDLIAERRAEVKQ